MRRLHECAGSPNVNRENSSSARAGPDSLSEGRCRVLPFGWLRVRTVDFRMAGAQANLLSTPQHHFS
jgi:hypothetical protein